MGDIKDIGAQFLSATQSQLRVVRMEAEVARTKGSASAAPKAQAEAAAAEFESLLVNQMIKTMWQAIPKTGLLTGGYEEEVYQEMLQHQLADEIGSQQSLGIRDMVLEEMVERGDFDRALNDKES